MWLHSNQMLEIMGGGALSPHGRVLTMLGASLPSLFLVDAATAGTLSHLVLTWTFFVCQAEFLNHAVEAILALYNGKGGVPFADSVMVIGHSLGGVVTR